MDEGSEPFEVVRAPLDVEVSHVVSEERFDAAIVRKRFQEAFCMPGRQKFISPAVDDQRRRIEARAKAFDRPDVQERRERADRSVTNGMLLYNVRGRCDAGDEGRTEHNSP